MRISSVLLAVLSTALAISASSNPGSLSLSSRHARLARSAPGSISLTKRCKHRPKKAELNNATSGTDALTSTSAKAEPTPNKATSKPSTGGLLSVQSNCGPTGATQDVTATSGPNGNIDWLNCGINDGGWRPPYFTVADVVTKDLKDAVNSPNSPFKACMAFVAIFEQYADQFGLPAILLASFAMQESSCNPDTVGGAGEQGLMQITKEKCAGAPNGNCRDPDFNIRTGAKFFADTLNNNNGNLLLSIGSYNGWFDSMTYAEATAAAKSDCCRCQNNLDYLHQFLNGWCQNINAYDNHLGKYFNLDVC